MRSRKQRNTSRDNWQRLRVRPQVAGSLLMVGSYTASKRWVVDCMVTHVGVCSRRINWSRCRRVCPGIVGRWRLVMCYFCFRMIGELLVTHVGVCSSRRNRSRCQRVYPGIVGRWRLVMCCFCSRMIGKLLFKPHCEMAFEGDVKMVKIDLPIL